jgi:hypothetical protein
VAGTIPRARNPGDRNPPAWPPRPSERLTGPRFDPSPREFRPTASYTTLRDVTQTHSLRRGPDVLSTVHNLCRHLSYLLQTLSSPATSRAMDAPKSAAPGVKADLKGTPPFRLGDRPAEPSP